MFLDEIGRVKDWKKAVNAFHAMNQYDIYITGSNADMLSSELSTCLAGRYVEILIHPFSFREFKQLYSNSNFNDFLIYGGIPSIHSFTCNMSFQ